jgi:diguanylate cyclase (GGDEF)-like protein/PAS domain S-box-containing protein
MQHRKNALLPTPQRLLRCIRQLHNEYKRSCDTQELFAAALDMLLNLTGSPYGAGVEVLFDAQGDPYFKIRAVIYPENVTPDVLDRLFTRVIDDGRIFISGKPAEKRRGGISSFPETFLGLPVYCGETLVGALGIANRGDGYDKKFAVFLQPLLSSFGTLLQLHRNEPRLEQAAQKLKLETAARERIENVLQDIATTVTASIGEEYFHSLVQQLSNALNVDAAFISIIADDEPGMADLIAFCDRGIMQEGRRYSLLASPCENVLNKGTLFYPRELQRNFPRGTLALEYGWMSYIGVPLRDISGKILGLVAAADRKPLPERQPAEAVLQICATRISAEMSHQRAEEKMYKLSRALEQTADAITITDNKGVIEYINPAFELMTGFSAGEALGHGTNIVKSGRHDAQFYRQLWNTLQRGQSSSDVFINRKKSGELYYEEKTITPLKDARDQITHYIATGKDITERMQTQERLHYLAYHDVLTELPNRALFLEWLGRALSQDNKSVSRLAVICLDINRFKIINDSLGHDVGDKMLLTIARLLKDCLGKGNTVARLNGDEFAVLMEHVTSPTDVISRISQILETLAQPLQINDHELYITISIGIAMAPEDGTDANTLLKNADAALYRAKGQGRHSYQFYSADLSDKALKQLSLETSLYRALERQEFHLCYQPQVSLASGKVMGLEALLRWQHPEHGLISPLEFIPLLEDTGLIIPVGEWVLRSACEEASQWQQLNDSPLRLSVNLSGRQFNDPHLHNSVETILAETKLAPPQLELEITESVLMQNDQASTGNLKAFQSLGVRIAIDDFGTGYSSLSYLQRFPVDTLKIDRSFIHDVIHNPGDETIIKAIIAMAQSLKVDTIAEGVETLEQLQFLRDNGCHTAQGFLLSKPFLASELPRFLQQPFALA